MQELPLVALRAFAAVYANGGVRAAARELGIAHSSVSRHVTELTVWLGVPLLRANGDRRQLTFTPQGEELGRATLAGLNQIATVVRSLREAKSNRSVVITAAPSFAARWLLPRLPALEAAHPRLEISLLVDQRLDDLERGEIDIAVRMGQGPWPGLQCEPLMDDALYPVMSPELWSKSGKPSRPADLSRLRLLHDRDPHASWELWRKAHGPKSLDVRSGPRFASSDLVLRAALQGQGVALARHRLAADEVAAGMLVRPCADLRVDIGAAYWIVMPHRLRQRSAVTTALAWLKSAARRQASP